MKIHNVTQRTPAWYNLRLGRITASKMDSVITSVKGDEVKQPNDYMWKLLCEYITKEPDDAMAKTYWMERGNDMEAEAIKLYEFTTGTETKSIGFVTTDDGKIGVSPDRFIFSGEGGAEIKCPAPWTHLEYLLNPDQFKKDYFNQYQTQIYVCEKQWWELYSYHPFMPPVRIRLDRDETRINKIIEATDKFMVKFEELKQKAIELGCEIKPMPVIEDENDKIATD